VHWSGRRGDVILIRIIVGRDGHMEVCGRGEKADRTALEAEQGDGMGRGWCEREEEADGGLLVEGGVNEDGVGRGGDGEVRDPAGRRRVRRPWRKSSRRDSWSPAPCRRPRGTRPEAEGVGRRADDACSRNRRTRTSRNRRTVGPVGTVEPVGTVGPVWVGVGARNR